MIKNKKSGHLTPVNFDHLINTIPELSNSEVNINNISITEPIDSSNMNPKIWIEIVKIIEKKYIEYDGLMFRSGPFQTVWVKTDVFDFDVDARPFRF